MSTVPRNAWLALPATALVIGAFAVPVTLFLAAAFTEPSLGLQNFRQIFGDSLYAKVLWNTAVISGATTVLALAFGYPLAYTIANSTPRARRFLIFVVLVPFWTSLLVRTFSWMVLLQPKGLINDLLIGIGLVHHPVELIFNRTGLLIGMVQVQLPFIIFPLYAIMSKIDPAFVRAASSLGATPVTAFLRVYLPLSMPGVVTGCLLVFVTSMGYFITPALLGGISDVMIAQLIHEQVTDIGTWGIPAALSLVLLVGTGLMFSMARLPRVRAARRSRSRS
ncbi:ABC transporter permease [Variovorax saccharolyticus]|uniref:ABC transporter permease n=1 Tax=Variovorax saccharolyticus TaxID=3053516 RepID=UPI002577A4D9|nr:ABC transporter permease [Variovorax sp. J22R187]MDM0021877.1 ABC transporter permease [Variovorax sp. J22R187]